jgi:prepilin-type N-terminal cleavage/methylation domain-containing protein
MTVRRDSGFTLIEVIVVLVLVSLLALIAGMGIVKGVEGYLFARENLVISQKAQLSLARMRLEMNEIWNVSSADADSIEFSTPDGTRKIGLDVDSIRLSEGAAAIAAGDILIDDVESFTLTYLDTEGSPWTVADNIRDLSQIRVDLVLNHSVGDANTVSFFTTVNPRNNGNSRGPVG